MRTISKFLVPILVCVLTASNLAYALLLKFDPAAVGERVSVNDVQQETGLAYIGTLANPELSDDELPTAAQLYMVEERQGNLLTRLRPYFGDSFAFAWLISVYTANYPHSTYELWSPLGPARALHDDIRKSGMAGFRFGTAASTLVFQPARLWETSTDWKFSYQHFRCYVPRYLSVWQGLPRSLPL